jgi:Divergent InlB B-repeat domain
VSTFNRFLSGGDLRSGANRFRPSRRFTLLLVTVAAIAGTMSVTASVAAATDFTWSGTGGGNWSTGANWGGAAPSGTVGTLTFPSAPCTSTASCSTTNDISGLTASSLAVVNPTPTSSFLTSLSWLLDGNNTLTLNSGLSVTEQSGGPPGAFSIPADIQMPITLGGDNTWTIGTQTGLNLSGGVSGASHTLAVNLSGAVAGSPVESGLGLGSTTNEVGAVTIIGPAPGSALAFVNLGDPVLGGGDLNGSNGNAVNVTDATLMGTGQRRPLTVNGGRVIPGSSGSHGILAVHGAITLGLDASSNDAGVQYEDLTPGSRTPVAGTDYSQITTIGAATIGAGLTLFAACNQTPGTTYTLVSATGALSGTFNSLPDGTVVQAFPDVQDPSCSGIPTGPFMRINYTAHTVTATVVATHTLNVSLSGSGSGSVTGNGINCPGTCSNGYPSGAMVTLTATPAAGSTFSGWSGGGCSGSGTCQGTMSSDQSVSASFTATGGGGGGTTTPPPGPTGQRAAALQKCKKLAKKKHWSHSRLKKCKRAANLLPV